MTQRDAVNFPPEPSVPDHEITLDELEQLASTHNPAIKQAIAAASRANGIRQQVGLKPNPTVGYFADEIGDNDAAGLHGAFLSQTIVTGGKLIANRRVLGHDVEAMRWRVEAQRVRVLADVRTRFFEALAARKQIELAQDFRTVAEKGVSIAKDRLDRDGTLPDLMQAEIQLSEVDLLIKRSDLKLNAIWKELVSIVGIPNLAPLKPTGDLRLPRMNRNFEETYQQIVDESPLLLAALQEVCRTRANLNRQKMQSRPNLTGQLGVGHDDSTGDEFVNLQLSMPIPVHNANQGNIRAAYAAYCEATQNVQRIKMQIRQDLAGVVQDYEVAEATAEQYETTILPKAKDSLDLITASQEAGEFDFLRVLTARKSLFDANQKYVLALSDLAAANTRIQCLLLSGGLANVESYAGDDSLRGQALSGQ